MIKPYTKYAFRAECQSDVAKFLTRISIQPLRHFEFRTETVYRDTSVEWVQKVSSELEVTFETQLGLETLRQLMMKEIPNGHVMLETLNYQKDYTGERYYDDH
ncbi:Hypothetical protein POVR1_LOCUS190 [uncultured virus]|nr:Hypothetical protein POVR1_LOCUS190 [uncultured virus]